MFAPKRRQTRNESVNMSKSFRERDLFDPDLPLAHPTMNARCNSIPDYPMPYDFESQRAKLPRPCRLRHSDDVDTRKTISRSKRQKLSDLSLLDWVFGSSKPDKGKGREEREKVHYLGIDPLEDPEDILANEIIPPRHYQAKSITPHERSRYTSHGQKRGIGMGRVTEDEVVEEEKEGAMEGDESAFQSCQRPHETIEEARKCWWTQFVQDPKIRSLKPAFYEEHRSAWRTFKEANSSRSLWWKKQRSGRTRRAPPPKPQLIHFNERMEPHAILGGVRFMPYDTDYERQDGPSDYYSYKYHDHQERPVEFCPKYYASLAKNREESEDTKSDLTSGKRRSALRRILLPWRSKFNKRNPFRSSIISTHP